MRILSNILSGESPGGVRRGGGGGAGGGGDGGGAGDGAMYAQGWINLWL